MKSRNKRNAFGKSVTKEAKAQQGGLQLTRSFRELVALSQSAQGDRAADSNRRTE